MSQLTETQRQLVEAYARNPNPTQVAKELGIHRSTVYVRLKEPGVQEAIAELQSELEPDSERSERIAKAQDAALELIEMQLQEQLDEARKLKEKGENTGSKIADIQKLMAIAEKLGNMKKAEVGSAPKEPQGGEEVDWGSDPMDEDDG